MLTAKEGDVAPQDTSQYGPNFEKLEDFEPEVVSDLKWLIQQFETEDLVARRDEIKRVRRARETWKGLHYLEWNEQSGDWVMPYQVISKIKIDEEELPRYAYVTNFYQAFGLSIIAVLSRKAPTVKLWPQSARQQSDVTAARAGSDAIELIAKNNRLAQLLIDLAFYLWTDGKIGAYVRYVQDAERFGTHQRNILQSQDVPMGPDRYVCPTCGADKPAEDAQDSLLNYCPQCQNPLSEDDLVTAPKVPVPMVSGTETVANGQEEISIVSSLELKTPSWARRMQDFPYLLYKLELHKSLLRASYQHVAAKIGATSGGSVVTGQNVEERTARLTLTSGVLGQVRGDPGNNLITFTRGWLRPWAFFLVDDERRRSRLLELFPKGCYCAFAEEVFCEARNVSMMDEWRVLHAYPGDGQNRPAMGESIIDLNYRYNDLSNIQQETYEFGIPPTYIDGKLLSAEAVKGQKVLPGQRYFVQGRPGMPISQSIYTPAPPQITPDMQNSMTQMMGPIAQFLTGAFPALFGGTQENTETASGYAMARDQAMGRLGLVWEAIKAFWAEVMMIALECFRRNRSEDVEIPLEGANGIWDSKVIKMTDLRGNLNVTPETEEGFPQMWAQLRATVNQLMESQDPYIQNILGDTSNLKTLKRLLGMDQLVIPDEDSETKQFREIQMMKASPPQMVQGQPSVGPAGEIIPGAPTFTPSVPVDPLVDDHAVEGESCKRWLRSPEGQLAKYRAPAWYANVRAHLQAHVEAQQQQQLETMARAMPPAAPSPTKQAA